MPCPSMGPKWFWTVQIVLVGYKMFWLSPNHYGRGQIILNRSKLWKISTEKSNLNLTKMIWTQPKRFGHDQNIFSVTKTIWTVQNHFGPIEGQGMRILNFFHTVCHGFYTVKSKKKFSFTFNSLDFSFAFVIKIPLTKETQK